MSTDNVDEVAKLGGSTGVDPVHIASQAIIQAARFTPTYWSPLRELNALYLVESQVTLPIV